MFRAGNLIKVYSKIPKASLALAVLSPSPEEKLLQEPSQTISGFNHHGEMFLSLPGELTIPSFPIHYDLKTAQPPADYQGKILSVIQQLGELAPEVFENLDYFFTPVEGLSMHFYQPYRSPGQTFLYLLKVDLLRRPDQGRILKKAGNDFTEEYVTDRIYVEPEILPIERIIVDEEAPGGEMIIFAAENLFTRTWLGERGRRYHAQGIWLDKQLSQILSSLLLPRGLSLYPYSPFGVSHDSLCHRPASLTSSGRDRHFRLFGEIFPFIAPQTPRIEQAARETSFSEDLPLYRELRNEIPESWLTSWTDFWKNFKLSSWFNESGQREHRLDY